MSKDEQKIKTLFKALSQRPIAYHRIYSQLTGSVTAGLYLSQIVYWWFAVEERPFYKTDADFQKELGMGPGEFRNAKSKMRRLKMVEIAAKGVPATTYYKVDISALLGQIYSFDKTYKLDCRKHTNRIVENVQTISTDNTTKTTAEIRKNSLRELSSADAEAEGLQMLTREGVHPKVARSLVEQRKHPQESIRNAIRNAHSRQWWLLVTDRFRAKTFRLAGYIVETLNTARREGHEVQLSQRSQAAERLVRDRQAGKRLSISEKETEKIRRQQLKKLGVEGA